MAHQPRFLDTNVLLRFLTRDDEEKARSALALILRIERGEEKVVVSPLVMFEVVFTLQKFYAVPRERITEMLLHLLSLRALELPGKTIFERGLRLYGETPLSFADAYSVAYMEARGIQTIYSWDTDFDRIADIVRIEPMWGNADEDVSLEL